jgi:hypothetical protein
MNRVDSINRGMSEIKASLSTSTRAIRSSRAESPLLHLQGEDD